MVKLRLWISPGACSLAPHVLLQESGLAFDLVTIDVTKGGFPEKHRALNPKGRIPILEYGDEIITETTAIMTMTSLLAPERQLFGATDLDAARVYEWLNWLSGTVHERGLGALFSPQWYTDDEGAWDGVRAKAREWIASCFGLVEERLAKTGGEHAVGGVYTAADVFLWVIYRWGYLLQMEMEELYPNWARVVAAVVRREAVRRTVEREGIPIVRDDRLNGKTPETVNRYDRKEGE